MLQHFDQELAQKVLDLIHESLDLDKPTPIINYLDPQTRHNQVALDLPQTGLNADQLYEQIKTYINNSAKTYHPYFCNQLWSGFSFPSFLAEMVSTAFNTSMYTYETAPIATMVEKKVITECLNLAHFKQGEGIFTTGGSASNMSALLAARNHLDPSIAMDGYKHQALSLFVSKDAHYSFAKAANVIGLGINNIYKINTLDNGKMDVSHLQTCIEQSLKKNQTPFFVSATTGTTVRGAFDSINDIANITDRYKLWLHVDGSWGASVLWHKKYKDLMQGIERADSLAWDAHKMLGLPLMCAMLLFKEKGMLAKAHKHGNSDKYIYRDEEANYNLGPISIQCGRKVDALKLYLTWQALGHEGMHDHIDGLYKQADFFTQWIEEHPSFKLFGPVESLNICFQYIHPGYTQQQTNDLNLAIRTRLLHTGQAMINYAYIDDDLIIRLILANPNMQQDQLHQLFKMIEKTALEILSQKVRPYF
ncbi:MAG TPA: pyridoxal-dependent decarboxylase [Oligoflexia bacterium]|nr:pyridoxal-dependent decarboxylase [Oligoflexia bacterium]HMR25308.1 pyridoxal-dependent decarboxylase [Oligoflexia bacterium]